MVERQKQPPEVLRKEAVLKNLANFAGKHLCWSLFLIKLLARRSATLFKRDPNTGAFLRNLLNFRTPILKNNRERMLLERHGTWFFVYLSVFMFWYISPPIF